MHTPEFTTRSLFVLQILAGLVALVVAANVRHSRRLHEEAIATAKIEQLGGSVEQENDSFVFNGLAIMICLEAFEGTNKDLPDLSRFSQLDYLSVGNQIFSPELIVTLRKLSFLIVYNARLSSAEVEALVAHRPCRCLCLVNCQLSDEMRKQLSKAFGKGLEELRSPDN